MLLGFFRRPRDSLWFPGVGAGVLVLSPAPDLDHLSQLSTACQCFCPAPLLSAALHSPHSTRQLCFYRQTRAGEGPGPLQRRPPSPVPPRPPVPHSRFAGSASCHSALCSRSWQGRMPGLPKARNLIRVIFLPPSSPPLSPKAPTQAGGLETGEREG